MRKKKVLGLGRIWVLMWLLLAMCLAGCGGSGEESGELSDQAVPEYVYEPEFFALEEENEYTSISDVSFLKDRVYYLRYEYDPEAGESSHTLCFRLLNDLESEEELSLTYEGQEGYETRLSRFYPKEEGGAFVLWESYPMYVEGEEYDPSGHTTVLTQYDENGSLLWERDLKEVYQDEENSYIQNAVTGSEGKLYMAANQVIYVFDGEGNHVKTIASDTDWLNGVAALENGRVFFLYYGDKGPELREIDTATDTLGDRFGNLPDASGVLKDNGEGRFLVKDGARLYLYDPATESSETVLAWADCNIYGSHVQATAALSDGRIAVYTDTYENPPELVLLTKKRADEVEQKELLTMGVLYESDQMIQSRVVEFNKKSSRYRIRIRGYVDEAAEWTETTYSDALTRLNADLAGGDSPDLIDLSNLDIRNLAAKGVLEDLTPYLESSERANKEDFLPAALKAYQYDGVQVAVPRTFQLATLLSRSSLVGEEAGWTMQDVMALAEEHPDQLLMYPVDKSSALRMCMEYAGETFIDYETGKTYFDGPEFLQVLEFANGFEDEFRYEESLPTMIQSGQVLLSAVGFGDVQEYQMYNLMFEEETTCIGYPTFDGSPGVFLNGSELYGISSVSEHKEGAWEFLESVLSSERDRHGWGFPAHKEQLDQLLKEAMTPEYITDEKGDPMKDENGEPMEKPKTSWGYDDWNVDIYAATEEEIEEIRHMIEIARPVNRGSEEIYSMIQEEVQPYFAGQKSASEVAGIIQSRVGIYVSENS
ncbi:MAG: extracellular solute-binding protein [Lachnospiraceae bacterium]|nr:extracellular solute-binding protein [Lachnospiraceae bacterium]